MYDKSDIYTASFRGKGCKARILAPPTLRSQHDFKVTQVNVDLLVTVKGKVLLAK